MNSPADLYVKGMRKKFEKYYAAWLPDETFRLGDVGAIENDFFIRLTSLHELGIEFEERPDTETEPSPMNFQSESGVEFSFKAAGEINPNLPNVPEAEAGVAVKFSELGAFVFNAQQSYAPSIENIAHVQKQILEAFKEGRWNSRWVVIVRLVVAPTATVIVSQSPDSEIELAAHGDISTTSFNLGDANITLKTCHVKNDVLLIPSAKEITPLFQVGGLKKRWYIGPYVSTLKKGYGVTESPDYITPEMVKKDTKLADSLYLGLVY